MLKLSRYICDGESIVIDDDITITILRDDQGRIDIGIDAPRDIPARNSAGCWGVSAPLDLLTPDDQVVTCKGNSKAD